MRYPLDNPNLGQPFGANFEDYSKFGIKGHDGQDFPTAIGTPIYAEHDGFIIAVNASNRAYGIYVALYYEENGIGYEWLHGHFDSETYPDISENINDKRYPVKEGDLIGYSGDTGNSTGPHLHLGLRLWKDGSILNHDNGFFGYVDPIPYLNALKIKDNNMFVKTMNYNGTVGLFIQADNPDHLKFLGSVFSKTIQENPDHSITTEATVTDK